MKTLCRKFNPEAFFIRTLVCKRLKYSTIKLSALRGVF